MNVTEQNKWDIRWLKTGDTFSVEFNTPWIGVDYKDDGYLDLGDGLYLLADRQLDGHRSYRIAVWARSVDYLRYLFVAGHLG